MGVPHLGKLYFFFFGLMGCIMVWWFQWWAPGEAALATITTMDTNPDKHDDDDVLDDIRRMELEVHGFVSIILCQQRANGIGCGAAELAAAPRVLPPGIWRDAASAEHVVDEHVVRGGALGPPVVGASSLVQGALLLVLLGGTIFHLRSFCHCFFYMSRRRARTRRSSPPTSLPFRPRRKRKRRSRSLKCTSRHTRRRPSRSRVAT